MDVNKLMQHSKMFLKRNSSTILTCIGGAGVVATTVMAVKATPKALRLLDAKKEEKGENLTVWETIETAGMTYVPTIITGTATIACIFGANMLNKRQQAALMSAYALLDNTYKDYQKKVGELYGEDANDNVKGEIVKDKYVDDEVSLTDDNKQLFYDEFSGRYFESTTEDVIKAEYNLNRKLADWYGVYLNEFYEMLGIEPVDEGDYLGWNSAEVYDTQWSNWIDFSHKKVTMDDGLECYILFWSVDPTFGFEDY